MGLYGRKEASCPLARDNDKEALPQTEEHGVDLDPTVARPEVTEDSGPWMLVQWSKRNQRNVQWNNGSKEGFDIADGVKEKKR